MTIIIPPELHGEEREILERLKRGERIDHFETIRISKDGRRIPVSLTVSPVRDSTGLIIGASKVARDISERKRAEYLQSESERLLAAEADALTKLNECSSRLWRSRSLNDGLAEMLAAVAELLNADKGTVQLLNPEHAVLEIAAQRGFARDFLEFFGRVSQELESASGRALRSGERVIIEDIEADVRYAPFRDPVCTGHEKEARAHSRAAAACRRSDRTAGRPNESFIGRPPGCVADHARYPGPAEVWRLCAV